MFTKQLAAWPPSGQSYGGNPDGTNGRCGGTCPLGMLCLLG